MSILSLFVIPLEEILHAFVWWYGAATRWMLRWFIHEVRMIEERDHTLTWARNLFTPMYGDSSIQGRLISVLMRFVVLAYRLLWAIVWIALNVIMVLSFLILPVLSIGMLITRFVGV